MASRRKSERDRIEEFGNRRIARHRADGNYAEVEADFAWLGRYHEQAEAEAREQAEAKSNEQEGAPA